MYFCQFVVINLIWLVLSTVTCVQLPCRLAQDPNCTLTISYHPQENLLAFHLDVQKLDCQWLAIGFNTQPFMIGTTVIVLEFTDNFRAYNGFLKYYNEPIYENNDLVNFELVHLNGRFGVKFKRSLNLYTEGALNFSNCNFVVVGVGALVANKFYTHVDTPVYSDSCWTKLDFNQITTRSDQIFTSSELSSDTGTTKGIELTNLTKFTTKNPDDDEIKLTQADLGAANNSTTKSRATTTDSASDLSEFSFFSSNSDQDQTSSAENRYQTTKASSQEIKSTSLMDDKFSQTTEFLLFPITTENSFSKTQIINESRRTSPKESITLTDNLSFTRMASNSIHQTEEETNAALINTTAQPELQTESTNEENLKQYTEMEISDVVKNTTAEILIQSSSEINMIQTTEEKVKNTVEITTENSEIFKIGTSVEDLIQTTEEKVNDTVEITTEDPERFTQSSTEINMIQTSEGKLNDIVKVTTEDSDIFTVGTSVEDLMTTPEEKVNDTVEITTENSEIFTIGTSVEDLIQTTEEKVNDTEKIPTEDPEIFTVGTSVEDLIQTTEEKVNDTEKIPTEDPEIFSQSTMVEDLMRTTEQKVNDTVEITTKDPEIFTVGTSVEDLIQTTEEKVNDTVEITTKDPEIFTVGTSVEDLIQTTEEKVNDTVEITTEDPEIFTQSSTEINMIQTSEGKLNDIVKVTTEDSDIFTVGTSVEDLMRTTEQKVNDTVEITTEDPEIFTQSTLVEDLMRTTEQKVNDTVEITTEESLIFTESSPDIELQTFTTISFNDPEISTSFEFLRETTKNLLETTQIFDLDNTSAFESSFVSDPSTQTLTSSTRTINLSSQTTSDSVNVETSEIDKITIDFLTTRTSSMVEQKTSDFKITTINSTQIFATKSEAISIDSTITSEFLASTEISTFEKTKSTEKIETSFQTSTQAETTKLETSNRVTQNTQTTTSTDFFDGIVTVPDLGSKMNTTKFSFTIPATTTTMATETMSEITDMVTNSTIAPFVDFLFLIQMRLGNSYLAVINETQAKLSQNLSDYTKKALMENNLVGYESIILLNITESERLAILFSLLKYRANASENDSQLKQNLETSLKNGDRTILNVNSVTVQKYTPSIDKPVKLTTAQSELKTNTILAIIFGSVFGALTLFLLLFICLMFYYCFKRRRSSYYFGGSANDYLVRI